MKYKCDFIEEKDYDENNRAWFYVCFKDDEGNGYDIEGYETSTGSVELVAGSKGLPLDIIDMVADHYDVHSPYYPLELNKTYDAKGKGV